MVIDSPFPWSSLATASTIIVTTSPASAPEEIVTWNLAELVS